MGLRDKTTSSFFEGQNALNKRSGKIVQVMVENETDIPFWKHLFEQCGVKTKIHPASKTDLSRGKEEVLKLKDQAGPFLLLCVDSDYDYLFDGQTPRSKSIKENPYIFQTYAYSVENYQCFAFSLHQVVLEATLNDSQVFDFEYFMEEYSKTVYELFLYSIFYERENILEEKETFTIHDFGKTISFTQQIDIFDSGRKDLAELREAIANKKAELPPIDTATIEALKYQLLQLGISLENTYLFINGHVIDKNVVGMFLEKVVKYLQKEKHAQINAQAAGDATLAKAKRSEYANRKIDTETVLRTHKYYTSCFLLGKIKADIEAYVGKVS